MARYVLVEVDENDRADRLIQKLEVVPGLRIIGLWFKPTRFCECGGPWDRSIRERKYGVYICPACKRPREFGPHQRPMNLLEPGVPETMQNVFLSIREPYQTPHEMHGAVAINKRIVDLRRTKEIIRDYWANQSARTRRVRKRRARR